MNIVYFYFICFVNFLTFTVANDCECVVEPWGDWSDCSVTCGSGTKKRKRICSTKDGWTLGLTCNSADASTKYDLQTCSLENCRELLFSSSQRSSGFYIFYFVINFIASWSSWTIWSTCSQTCDTGRHNRNKECISASGEVVDAKKCDGEDFEIQKCIIVDCREY